jgi:hypothetical protein
MHCIGHDFASLQQAAGLIEYMQRFADISIMAG